jgi:hypothetical protein
MIAHRSTVDHGAIGLRDPAKIEHIPKYCDKFWQHQKPEVHFTQLLIPRRTRLTQQNWSAAQGDFRASVYAPVSQDRNTAWSCAVTHADRTRLIEQVLLQNGLECCIGHGGVPAASGR